MDTILTTEQQQHINKVLEYFGVSFAQVQSKDRKRRIAEARHTIAALLRGRYGMTYQEIGEQLGGRDHTTILHSVNKFHDFMEIGERFTLDSHKLFYIM